ncbi:hypothetical protein TRIATDRAFT_297505 [Trichoderma atroviride IMI 206040]|uniref:Transmembrane protein n=1 Tax=Hypocrea atroviridis (strain ATCC 20476 / IMI 206040) TaxID=452589 RepID=G9NI92_HYPAI|nr:uncharacterized protein TRIATDRAFT_297505 [Trichoderma atroviride IMI 206040]EHK49505.1 hypothetical protein TRIATDRAFT_297505 [Trichoderma atroviride IMI 206040]
MQSTMTSWKGNDIYIGRREWQQYIPRRLLYMRKLSACFTTFFIPVKLTRHQNATQTNHCRTTAMARISSPILLKRLRDSNLLRRRILLSRAIFILRHSISRPQRLLAHASSSIFSHRNRPNKHMGPLPLDDNHKHHPRDVLLDSNGHRKPGRGSNRDGDDVHRVYNRVRLCFGICKRMLVVIVIVIDFFVVV